MPPPLRDPAVRTTCATSRSSPTSTTGRRPSSTASSARPGPFAPTRRSSTASLTPATSTREGHNDPCQADRDRLRRHAPEDRRHARPRRFGGEVERGLLMVDAVLLLVDASEGPLPRRAMCSPRRWSGACRSSSRSTRSTVPMPGRPRCSTRLRAVHRPRRRQAPDRVPGRLHECEGGDRDARPRPPRHRSAATARPARRGDAGAGPRAGSPAPAARHLAGGERLRRPHGRRPHPQRDGAHRPAGGVVREEADDTAGAIEPGRTVTLAGRSRRSRPRAALNASTSPRRARARSSPSPACRRSPSATRSPIRLDPRPLPRLDVDAPTLRMTFGVNTSPPPGATAGTSRAARSRLASSARCSETCRSR